MMNRFFRCCWHVWLVDEAISEMLSSASALARSAALRDDGVFADVMPERFRDFLLR